MPILPMVKVTTEEKVSSMYRQQYEEPSQVQEEYDPKVYGESMEKKLQSVINRHWRRVRITFDGCQGLHCQQEVSNRNS